MIIRHVLILLIIVSISACTTVTDNVIEKSIGLEDYKKVDEIDLLVLEYRISNDISYLSRAEANLKAMITDKSYNKDYEALLYGFAGEIEFYKGNNPGVKKNLQQVETRSRYVEYFFILSAMLEKKLEKKIEVLEEGVRLANTTGKIKLYLAFYYFESNIFNKATACFDDAFELLDPKYEEYYAKDRDLAYQLIENPETDSESREILEKEEVSFSHVISLTLTKTDFLTHITADKSANPLLLLDTLKNYGYVHRSIESPDELCTRKDVAYFLISILAYLENAPDLKEKYKKQFIESDADSPVPDVQAEDYYFSAVLVLVEKEIMELPNGIHFLPYKPVSGIEYNELLMKIQDRYY